ncbi:MAG: ANTAR domain-containing protein [Deltaproteobacteria bacterium]|nr:ANTAR domain-containing protein [Deltaproteobacteria bacterium]MCL4874983.1 ANTAR domain-containing protein [bacterium]
MEGIKKTEKEETFCTMICQQYLHLQSENTELKRKLKDRRIIEKAKWVLVKTRGLNEEEAHSFLINASRKDRIKIVETAKVIISAQDLISAKDKGSIKPPGHPRSS